MTASGSYEQSDEDVEETALSAHRWNYSVPRVAKGTVEKVLCHLFLPNW